MFNETHSREELKIIFSVLRIIERLFLVNVTSREFSVLVKSVIKKGNNSVLRQDVISPSPEGDIRLPVL
jgi:hypothetical protein